MKRLVLVVVSMLMMAPPAMSFDQDDLNSIDNADQLMVEEGVALDSDKFDRVNDFLGRRRFVCVAENGRGNRFRARHRRRPRARRMAMRKCRQNSRRPRSCEILRCRRRGGGLFDLIDLIND